MTPVPDSDRIERSIIINAPRARVWQALSNAGTFGIWFGANLEGQAFAPGKRTRGRITIRGHEDAWFDVLVVHVEPEDLLSFHWHPYAVDPAMDYSHEQPTLVTFTLQEVPGPATLLKVVESGFDKVPPQRRQEAFRMNTFGWQVQMDNIARHAGA